MTWMVLKVVSSQPEGPKSASWTHPLFQLKSWDIQRPRNCDSPKELAQEVQSSTKDQVWFLDVQPQRGDWIVFCSEASTSELFQRWQNGISLQPLLSYFKESKTFVIFNIHASQQAEAEDFLEVLKDFEKSDRVAIISPSRVPVETIRKKRPQWFFGSDRTSWTKVVTFNSIGLQGLVKHWADFYILTERDQQALNEKNELIRALLNQNKVLIKESSSIETNDALFRGVLPVRLR